MKKEINISKPLLSVCLITYNHCQYIRQAIEGVLMQKVNFDWEFIIADDFSTDGTRDIIKEYAKKFPSLIQLILREKNVGAAKNWMELMASPRGKYVAYFEGDDYWTDPLKLQKQVDFLESNADYSICFHKVIIKKGNDLIPDFITEIPAARDTFYIDDLIKGNFIHTPTVIFRNHLITIPDWFCDSPIGDYPLYILLSLKGKIKLLNESMAVYRYGTGIWSRKSHIQKLFNTLKMFYYVKHNLPEHVNRIIYERELKILRHLEKVWLMDQRTQILFSFLLSIYSKLKYIIYYFKKN